MRQRRLASLIKERQAAAAFAGVSLAEAMSAPRVPPPAAPAPAAPVAAAATAAAARKKTRAALLGGLKTGALEAAVAKMEGEGGAPPSPAPSVP
eukprot:SAG22_NODE_237_length_14221_cov_37.207832_4_plen_94_part_00